MNATRDVRYFVFDIESVADGELIASVRYPQDELTPEEAVARYRAELLEEKGTDFIPYTFQVPLSIAVGKVNSAFELIDLVVLDEGANRPHVATDLFWRGWEAYGRPTLVTFNGRSFDLPLLELAAFRYGISVAGWFDSSVRAYDQPRNRYNTAAHFDLHEMMTNFGASRFTGGLNLAAQILGKPGKMDVQGDMVQDLFFAGQLDRINGYCRCDVLDTYFVFLRTQVMLGKLPLDAEQQLVRDTRQWLEAQRDSMGGIAEYLDRWGEWPNPWLAQESPEASAEESAPTKSESEESDQTAESPEPA